MVDAEMLVILTGVDKVCLNFGTSEEQRLDEMTVDEAKKYMVEGQFEEGTMLPKIETAIEFIGNSAVRKALITKLDVAFGESHGTIIHK